MMRHVLQWALLSALVAGGALHLAACTTPGDDDPVGDFCGRLDECNALPAGSSAADCSDYFGDCVDELSSSEAADWRTAMADCLEYQACSTLIDCWAYEVPYC